MTKGIVKVEGIECDNPKCDYTNTDIKVDEYEDWINVPCPKCGNILLTENDYNVYKLLTATTNIANKIPENGEAILPSNTTKIYKPHSL